MMIEWHAAVGHRALRFIGGRRRTDMQAVDNGDAVFSAQCQIMLLNLRCFAEPYRPTTPVPGILPHALAQWQLLV